jgi:hypothetical protein
MKTKEDIVQNWLPRYKGEKLENFGEYILLTIFSNYVEMFAKWNKVKVVIKTAQCSMRPPIILPSSIFVWVARHCYCDGFTDSHTA